MTRFLIARRDSLRLCAGNRFHPGRQAYGALPGAAPAAIFATMFVVTEADAAAIRAVYKQEVNCRPPSRCAGCSLASSTTRTPGAAHGPLPGGRRGLCRPPR